MTPAQVASTGCACDAPAEWLEQANGGQQRRNGRALAAGQAERVELFRLRNAADQRRFDPQCADSLRMRVEIALQGQHSNPQFTHGAGI